MFITQCCDHRCGHHKHVLVVTVIAAVIYVAFAAALTLAFATVLAVSLAVVDVLAFGIVLVGCCWCHAVGCACMQNTGGFPKGILQGQAHDAPAARRGAARLRHFKEAHIRFAIALELEMKMWTTA